MFLKKLIRQEPEPEEDVREIKIISGEDNSKPPRPIRRMLDVLIGAALIIAALAGFGAYIRLAAPAAGIGLVTVVVQKLINRGEPSEAMLKVSMGIRIFAGIVLVLLIAVMYGFGSGSRGFYSIRKGLYTFGNGISAEELSHLPDSLPETCEELYMEFDAPRWGRSGSSHIGIVFRTDRAGAEELEKAAQEKGGTLCDRESFAYKKVRVFCESNGQQIGDAQVYLLCEMGEHCPAYLINKETGVCAIHW